MGNEVLKVKFNNIDNGLEQQGLEVIAQGKERNTALNEGKHKPDSFFQISQE